MNEFTFKSDSMFKIEFKKDMLRLYPHTAFNKNKLSKQNIDVSFGCIKSIDIREFGIEYQYQVVQLQITGISFGNIIQFSCLKSDKEEYANLLSIRDKLVQSLKDDFDADFTKKDIGNGTRFIVNIRNLEKKGQKSKDSTEINLREDLANITEIGIEMSKDMKSISELLTDFAHMLIYFGEALIGLGTAIIIFSLFL